MTEAELTEQLLAVNEQGFYGYISLVHCGLCLYSWALSVFTQKQLVSSLRSLFYVHLGTGDFRRGESRPGKTLQVACYSPSSNSAPPPN